MSAAAAPSTTKTTDYREVDLPLVRRDARGEAEDDARVLARLALPAPLPAASHVDWMPS